MIALVQRVSEAAVTIPASGYRAAIGPGLCVLLGVEAGDGSNEATRVTDDPAVGGTDDPTVFLVATLIEVPTVSQVGLVLLTLLLFLAVLRTMRAQRV